MNDSQGNITITHTHIKLCIASSIFIFLFQIYEKNVILVIDDKQSKESEARKEREKNHYTPKNDACNREQVNELGDAPSIENKKNKLFGFSAATPHDMMLCASHDHFDAWCCVMLFSFITMFFFSVVIAFIRSSFTWSVHHILNCTWHGPHAYLAFVNCATHLMWTRNRVHFEWIVSFWMVEHARKLVRQVFRFLWMQLRDATTP